MPVVTVRGVSVGFDEAGSGDPVVLVAGYGSRGQEWNTHQVPALVAAGYQVIAISNRGVPPSDVGPPGFTVRDMAEDVAGLIEATGIGPCRIVGHSLGGIIALEALLGHPDLFIQGVAMAARGRTDVFRSALAESEHEYEDAGVRLPPRYAAALRAMRLLSPRTLNDEQSVRDWLDVFELFPPDDAISLAQRGVGLIGNRLEDYRAISSSCLVIGFADDLVVPPFFCREIAESLPCGRYEEIAGCGHCGHLERPETVNSLILDFFRES